ncbi:peptidoglycan-binding protein [Streptomyces hokutonensis]|uniref:peptidoglycan-binding protein n=1 Tax=Streptomyces hokutonensis TaxID=1306990 RepID=UPI003810E2AB
MGWTDVSDVEPGDVISILGIDHVFFEEVTRTGGTASWNDQNPGNIISSGEAEQYGAYAGKHNDIFAVFPDEATGFTAVRRYLEHRGGKTVLDVMRAYAPAGHGANDPQAYAQRIADALQVGTDTTLGELDDNQRTAFAQEIQRVEGWRSGEEHGPDDLPDDLAQWLTNHPSREERLEADQPFAKTGTVAEGVKNIQRRLNELGWSPPLDVDGKFGPHSAAAARWFQTNNGLTADGIVGNQTWRRLVDSQG